ncbi:hypothetical protein WDW86_11650 [Bdellovibrionota bacterium FG-2]
MGHAALRFIEGIVHARLSDLMQLVPLKSQLHYYKPYSIDSNGKVKYGSGEIDFVFQLGDRIVPLEVKATAQISDIDFSLLKLFVKEHRVPFGVVLYGGLPVWNATEKVVFWPYWLV